MKNVDVIKGFVNGGKVYVNPTKYSVTTSKAQGYLRYYLNGCGIEVEAYVPKNANSLASYITKK